MENPTDKRTVEVSCKRDNKACYEDLRYNNNISLIANVLTIPNGSRYLMLNEVADT
jgi:hypothetical protein